MSAGEEYSQHTVCSTLFAPTAGVTPARHILYYRYSQQSGQDPLYSCLLCSGGSPGSQHANADADADGSCIRRHGVIMKQQARCAAASMAPAVRRTNQW